MNAIATLRLLAVSEALNVPVGADVLIAAGVQALLDGVDSPSLSLLAGLSRREEGEAQELFHDVVAELALTPTEPLDFSAERWNLVRWWCEQITDGTLEPEVAGRKIWFHGWMELGFPEVLQPMLLAVNEWEDWNPSWNFGRDHYQTRITDEAVLLLRGSWPP
ncbi:hypothetical protein [Arthrobacter sp. RCC_34]|uniref:hypothetical protein n=1 Tax=Arthrobacter sp. RCC_34 TaxID=3239230 RepID=UPI003525364A